MERRKSQQSNQSQSICSRCGCGFESGRTIHKNTRYCRECAPIARREQSAAWKQRFRALFGWRKYHENYSPFVDAEAEREHRKLYMRRYRKRKRGAREADDYPVVLTQQAA
jgi:hypothetical protein